MGEHYRSRKFGYYKASSKVKKSLFLMEYHRCVMAAPSKFQINAMVISLEGLLDIFSHLCDIKLFSFFHNSPFV